MRPSLRRQFGKMASLSLLLVFSLSSLFAAEKTEWTDENKDGKNETQFFYEDGKKVKAEVDLNGDGRPERFVKYKDNKIFSAEVDRDSDGTVDEWEAYDSEGRLKTDARDGNKDGKPDQFWAMIQGRNVVLREADRNYDGRIDMRSLNQWDPEKRLTTMAGSRVVTTSTPGYVSLWIEQDDDFDAKIDIYRERGNKNPSPSKIGQAMSPAPVTLAELTQKEEKEEKEEEQEIIQANNVEDRIKRLNEKYGLSP